MNDVDNRDNIVIIGGGVSSIFMILELLESSKNGKNIYMIEKGKNPYERSQEEVMIGFMGAGGFSDGKIVYSFDRGGDLISYTGVEKGEELILKIKKLINKFHPDPSKLKSELPQNCPEFIEDSPFELIQNPLDHIGTNYLLEISKRIFEYFKSRQVNMMFNTQVIDVDFEQNIIKYIKYINNKININPQTMKYDELVLAVGKSGSELIKSIISKYNLPTKPRYAQIGVRFETDMKYFKPIIDIQYDFKLSKKYKNNTITARTFCVNNKAAYIAKEIQNYLESFNGHAYIEKEKINNLTNFGIILELPIKDPYGFTLNLVNKANNYKGIKGGKIYNPNNRELTVPNIKPENVISDGEYFIEYIREVYGYEISDILINFIVELDRIFKFHTDYVIYSPEIKYLLNTIVVDNNSLSLNNYPNVHFIGDCLSARGIFVSAAQGIYLGEWFNLYV